jgi:hypothetical protein
LQIPLTGSINPAAIHETVLTGPDGNIKRAGNIKQGGNIDHAIDGTLSRASGGDPAGGDPAGGIG